MLCLILLLGEKSVSIEPVSVNRYLFGSAFGVKSMSATELLY
jgi:hypothetical protein